MSQIVYMRSDSCAMRLPKGSFSVMLVENSLFGELVLSDFGQSNLRRGYDGKCRYCPRVWFEFSGGLPG